MFVISIATFMEVLDVAVADVALAPIGGSLSASYDETTWVLTSYLIANAIVIPISGWLSDVFVGQSPAAASPRRNGPNRARAASVPWSGAAAFVLHRERRHRRGAEA